MNAPPPYDVLESGLRGLAAAAVGADLDGVHVVRRRRNWYQSSFPTELVTVRTRDRERVLFCKHGQDYVDEKAQVRRGPGYEAEVDAIASCVLEPDVPRSYGVFTGDHGSTYVTEFIAPSLRLSDADSPYAAVDVCRRLGALHRRAAPLARVAGESLNHYDTAHFERWVERLGTLALDCPVATLITSILPHSSDIVRLLSGAEQTLVHGELYPANVLVAPDAVVLVDWETAGIGAGELDLAALTVGNWADDIRTSCERAYVRGRWDGVPPDRHEGTLAGARLYSFALVAMHLERRSVAVEPWLEAQIHEAISRLKVSR